MQSEEYWSKKLSPLARQMTHRKNDYGTILGLLKSVKPSRSKNLISLNEAHDVPREIGRWFVVEASERNVVRLGIGANPGLKKYYWRANGSKRLLKREMEDNSEPADLVYIIQKAQTVSKRCASIPGTDHWLVMYLPSTLRSKNSPKRVGATTFPQTSTSSTSTNTTNNNRRTVGPTKRKRSSPTRRNYSTNGATLNNSAISKKAIQSKKIVSKVSVGPSRKAALRKTTSLPLKSSSASIKLSSSAVANIIKSTSKSSKTVQKSKTTKRTKRRNSLLTLFKLSEPFSIKSTISSDDDELNQLINDSFDSDYSSDDEINVVDVEDDHVVQQPKQPMTTSTIATKSVKKTQKASAQKKQKTNNSPARGCAEYSLFGNDSSELFFNPCWNAPPPTTSKVSEPDPFLPLAGSQTSFSAVIEAAAMSGNFLAPCGFDNFSRLSVSPPTQSSFLSF